MAKSFSFVLLLMSTLSICMTHEFDPDHKNQYHHSLDEDRSKPDGAQRHCDKVTCGTIVKKCVRTERCNNAHLHEQYAQWAKRCIDCLEEKFGKCCGCVGLCRPPPKETHSSHVGDIPLDKTYNELFEVLTETDDIHGRWLVLYNVPSKIYSPKNPYAEINNENTDEQDETSLEKEVTYTASEMSNRTCSIHNSVCESTRCTMAFINKYLNMMQCRKYCKSMGATRYRWFDEGCCECLGKHCKRYGLGEPRCVIQPFE